MLNIIAAITFCSSILLSAGTLSLRLVVSKDTPNAVAMSFVTVDGKETVFVASEEIIDEQNVTEARVDFSRKGSMFFRVDAEGGKLMTQATKNAWTEKMKLAVIIDGKLDSVLQISNPIKEQFMLNGMATDMNTLTKLGSAWTDEE